MSDKPKVTIELKPGNYLISIHPGFGVRVWKQDQFFATFIGKTGKLKRQAVADAFRDLTIQAEKAEGIAR